MAEIDPQMIIVDQKLVFINTWGQDRQAGNNLSICVDLARNMFTLIAIVSDHTLQSIIVSSFIQFPTI